jgi:myo-inositol-hexaphosphate 3-phosphohydrolase
MGQRPSTISQADLSRLIRAGRKEGARAVKVSLKTGEVAEFVLVDNGNGGNIEPAKLARKAPIRLG